MGAANMKMVEAEGREVGYREGPRNNETKYGAEFGFNFVAWCAIFQCILAKWTGVTYLGKVPRFASTCAWQDHAKKNGRWSTTPRVGSIAMRRYGTTYTGHVGAVVGVGKNGVIYTREGNTNDEGAREGNGVWNRARVGFWQGYILLDEVDGGTPPVQPPYTPPPSGQINVDGGFGPATVRKLQQSLNSTGAHPHLAEDSDFGPATKKALQARLNHVAGPVAIDGDFGPRSIKALQRHVGVTQDGEWGPNTTRALQTKLNAGTF